MKDYIFRRITLASTSTKITAAMAWFIMALMSASSASRAQEAGKLAYATQDDSVFILGRYTVYGQAEQPADAVPVGIGAKDIELLEKKDLSEALSLLPGVTLTRFGGRNETAVMVRGYARNQVPLYIDGIPVYVPYDGIIDLGRFTTYDVAALDVAKGYSSTLYGPNTMGGAINISTRKPTRVFEGQLAAGVFSGKGAETSVNVGSRQTRWYFQGGASWVDQDYYPLSGKFTAVAAEDGGHRDNSYHTDWKVSAKVGCTPNSHDEYAIGFNHQEGVKGNPVQTTAPKYWKWPQWDKQTVYFISNTRLGESSYLKPRFYYDTYDNSLMIFDDATYKTQSKSSSGTSRYNEYTYGGSLELGTELIPSNVFKGIVHYKFDQHREHPDVNRTPSLHYIDEDASISYGLEDTLHLSPKWDVQAGLSYDTRDTQTATDTTTGKPFRLTDFSAVNPQAGVFYKLDEEAALHLTISHKSRFPTMKERYSYRMGTGIPNADLDAEKAMHYELGYVGKPTQSVAINAAVFYSRVNDTIQQVYLSPTSTVSQFQNIGTAEKAGFDIGLDWKFSSLLSTGLSYSYLQQKTLTTVPKNTEPFKATDTPGQSGNFHADVRPAKWLSIVPGVEYSSWRYSYSDGKGTNRKVGGFTVANLKLVVRLPHNIETSIGSENVFDKNYALQEGYPEAGRTWFANVRYNF
jgi:iron complex outermembrane receptor protein